MEIFMKDKYENIIGEDTTKYGEFISSFDAWLSFEQQKSRAEYLENNTKNSKTEQIFPE